MNVAEKATSPSAKDSSAKGSRSPSDVIDNLSYWLVLLIAVLAVPAFAILVVVTINPSGSGAIVVFVLTCWLCVFLGLRIVKNPAPQLAVSYPLEYVTFPHNEQKTHISTIAQITKEMNEWKAQYEKTSASFMNLSKQPAWDYLNELVAILGKISNSMSADIPIGFADLKALNAWVTSTKAATIEAYLHALRAAYAYARCSAADQGKDIDVPLHPDLEKGKLEKFEHAPNHAKTYAWELLSKIRGKHPFISAQLNYESSKAAKGPFPFWAKLVK